MTPAQARYKMRQSRHCKITGASGSDVDGWETWYYVDHERGIDVLVRKPGSGTVSVLLTRKQLEQAAALMRAADRDGESL